MLICWPLAFVLFVDSLARFGSLVSFPSRSIVDSDVDLLVDLRDWQSVGSRFAALLPRPFRLHGRNVRVGRLLHLHLPSIRVCAHLLVVDVDEPLLDGLPFHWIPILLHWITWIAAVIGRIGRGGIVFLSSVSSSTSASISVLSPLQQKSSGPVQRSRQIQHFQHELWNGGLVETRREAHWISRKFHQRRAQGKLVIIELAVKIRIVHSMPSINAALLRLTD